MDHQDPIDDINNTNSDTTQNYPDYIDKTRTDLMNAGIASLLKKIDTFISKIEPNMLSEETVNKLPRLRDEKGNDLSVIDYEKAKSVVRENVNELSKLHGLHEDIIDIWKWSHPHLETSPNTTEETTPNVEGITGKTRTEHW